MIIHTQTAFIKQRDKWNISHTWKLYIPLTHDILSKFTSLPGIEKQTIFILSCCLYICNFIIILSIFSQNVALSPTLALLPRVSSSLRSGLWSGLGQLSNHCCLTHTFDKPLFKLCYSHSLAGRPWTRYFFLVAHFV